MCSVASFRKPLELELYPCIFPFTCCVACMFVSHISQDLLLESFANFLLFKKY